MIPVQQIVLANTFSHWLVQTNLLANLMTSNVVTVGGTGPTGNASVNGAYICKTLVANVIQAGGANLDIQSTVVTINVSSKFVAYGNVAINGIFTANTLTVTNSNTVGNAVFGTNTIFVYSNGSIGVGMANTANGTICVNGSIWATGDISGFQSSDVRLKKEIENIDPANALYLLGQLVPIEFQWNELADQSRYTIAGKAREAGVLAQDMLGANRNLVSKRPDGYYAVNYIGIIPYLISAINNLSERIKVLEAR